MRRRPGRSWRILAHGPGPYDSIQTGTRAGSTEKARARGSVFDELCIDDWLHLEQMDDRLWWLNLGDRQLVLWIEIPKRGKVRIGISEENGKIGRR
jgi:hypothetical protein